MIICGIGSRETPLNIQSEMITIGKWIRENGHTCRSGHAAGADWAFEQGAQERCITYLPWDNFNLNLNSLSEKVIVSNQADYLKFTQKYHPNLLKLNSGGIKLMNRNVCQVLGLYLNKQSDLIICWTKDGKDSGGTGQALRIAKDYSIPILNMYHAEYNSAIKVINFILNKY